MTLKIALLLVSLLLFALGGHGLYHASLNRAQTAVSCEQLVRQRPAQTWLRISGCELDYVGAGYREVRGQIAELYFPVRPAQADPAAPVPLVAVTSNPEALAIAQSTMGDGRQPDQEAFLVMMLRIVTTLRASREVEGTIRTNPLLALSTRRALAGMGASLAPNVAVIDLHATPSFLLPGLEAAVGFAALLAFVALLRRRPAPAGAAAPAEATVPADAPRLPALMLLNLPDTATGDDIEKAPPLGTRKEVAKRSTRALKGLKFTGGRGVLKTSHVDLTIDLGDHDVVSTAIVRARGAAAAESVRALARATGWRVYVPKRGAFITFEQIDEIATP